MKNKRMDEGQRNFPQPNSKTLEEAIRYIHDTHQVVVDFYPSSLLLEMDFGEKIK